eukprot:31032-Pelagococcus_subviridis.AAC.14
MEIGVRPGATIETLRTAADALVATRTISASAQRTIARKDRIARRAVRVAAARRRSLLSVKRRFGPRFVAQRDCKRTACSLGCDWLAGWLGSPLKRCLCL